MTRTEDFRYELPAAAIAQDAVEPRDAARLLVARTLQDLTVADLPSLLDPGDLVVVNSTRVRAARLAGRKRDTGGAVEALLLESTGNGSWRALCKPSRRLRPGIVVEFGGLTGEIVAGPVRGVVELAFHRSAGEVEDLLPRIGTVPLPPYFHGALRDPERYQTIFAKQVGSAAAPTAGLHFSPRLVAALGERGVELADVDLEVGIDTFRPISTPTLETHAMHREAYRIPDATAELIASTRASGGRVIAIGTTVVRALESSADDTGAVAPGDAETGLFITPGYEFRVVDAVLTNFHAPATSLIVMIAAMIGAAWRDVYGAALARGYRFLSFGDAMYVNGVRRR